MVLYAATLGTFARGKYFMHGLWVGIISGVLGVVLMYLMFDTYVANSAAMREAMAKLPEGWDMRNLSLITSVIFVPIGAVVTGLLAMLGGKVLGSKPASETTASGGPSSPSA